MSYKHDEKQKILHIITGLNTGGAETMLSKLLINVDSDRFQSVVVSLLPVDTRIGNEIREMGVMIYSLGMNRGIPSVTSICRLWKIIHEIKPDVIQGWMYHGNLAAYLAKRLSRTNIPVVWNIRQSLYDILKEKRLTRYVINSNAKFSNKVEAVIYNSHISMKQHEEIGFDQSKSTMIGNGFNTEQYKNIHGTKDKFDQKYKMFKNTFLIGMVARYHPMKDHETFIKAAGILRKMLPQAHIRYVLVGKDISWENQILTNSIEENLVQDEFILLNESTKIAELISSFDVFTLSSWAEAFPNVIGEAMACERVCVVTDVGDSRIIVGDTGFVVPPRSAIDLANAWKQVYEMKEEQREQLGKLARQRIIDNYSIEKIAKQYEQLYLKIL